MPEPVQPPHNGAVFLSPASPDAAAPRVEIVHYDDDHPCSAHRIALAQNVTQGLTAARPAQ